VLKQAMAAHTAVYRATGGLIGHSFPGMPSILLLDHVGAKSGKRRSTPLVYAKDGLDIVLIASKGGHPKNPAWYHNLMANPETSVQIGRDHHLVRAREARQDERDRLWQKACEAYSGYETYRVRTDRQIPIIVLEPRS
jgi:deazaflavin-dependent oxidoreductase (nitroreductase family)